MFRNKVFPSESVNYLEIYNASEGFFGVQDDISRKDEMMLMLDYGIFYEFIPMEEIEKEYPKAVSLDEVEIGKITLSSFLQMQDYGAIKSEIQFDLQPNIRIDSRFRGEPNNSSTPLEKKLSLKTQT
jgi:hypothetical protein